MTAHLDPQRLGLVVHPTREVTRALELARAWARTHGADVVQVREGGQERVVADLADAASCDLVLAMGGDGTTLVALHAAAEAGRPVLGVACGSLGALTATSADELPGALDAVQAGAWRPRLLPGAAIAVDGAEPEVALNDLVVVRRGAGQIAIGIEVDGDRYVRFAGDGIVIATPLGSSAYTMAAGGPILAPASRGLVLTPLAPHGGCCPPLVTGPESCVTVSVEPGHSGARIEFDGRIQAPEPHLLEVRWRAEHATLVAFDDAEPFLAGLRRRRILIDSPRVLARDDRAAATTRR